MKKDPIISLVVDYTDLQRIIDILLSKNGCNHVVVKENFSVCGYVVEGYVLEDEQ